VSQIYAEFSHGNATPHAIRGFLRWAVAKWGTRYAVLVGEGSVDYGGLMVEGDSMVPTLFTPTPYGLFACDSCLADTDGDVLPNLAISRIPASDADELNAYVAKVQRYENSQIKVQADQLVFLAGSRQDLAGDFPGDSDKVASLLPATAQANVHKVYRSEHDAATTAAMTRNLVSSGVGWVNHFGHGGSNQLTDFLYSADVGALGNAGHTPIVSAMTCAANRFEIPGHRALGENLVLDADGGAIAFWAPSGQSYHGSSRPLNEALLNAVFTEQSPTLGDALLTALEKNKDSNLPFVLRMYTLIGDAALRLQ
jgi:hypothetical protein